MLAVGVKPDGTFPAEAVERLKAIGSWMSHSSEAIYDTLPGPHASCFYGPMTRRGNKLYLHVFDPPEEEIEVRGIDGIDGDITQAYLLKTGEGLNAYKQIRKIFIDLPEEKCDEFNTVIVLEFKKEPSWPAP